MKSPIHALNEVAALRLSVITEGGIQSMPPPSQKKTVFLEPSRIILGFLKICFTPGQILIGSIDLPKVPVTLDP